MKLLLVAFLAVAYAAEIKIQSLVLPEPPQPEVYEAPETQNEETYDAVKVAEDFAPFDDEETPIHFQMIDLSPLIVPEEVMRQVLANLEFIDDDVDDVQLVDSPLDAVQVVDFPLDAVQVVDFPLDAVKVVDTPAVQDVPFNSFYVPDIESDVDPVQIVDGPVDASEDVQVDPVVVVDSVQYEMPLEYRRGLPIYSDPMWR